MILIGQCNSSFVRHVGIALRLHALPFDHRPRSVAGDFARQREVNPLGRVPVQVPEDGTARADTFAILGHLDSLVPEARALCPRAGPLRREGLRVSALASGLMDKGIAAFSERAFHAAASEAWLPRRRAQIAATLARLEAERGVTATPHWLGAPDPCRHRGGLRPAPPAGLRPRPCRPLGLPGAGRPCRGAGGEARIWPDLPALRAAGLTGTDRRPPH